jgi:hypothetical protein
MLGARPERSEKPPTDAGKIMPLGHEMLWTLLLASPPCDGTGGSNRPIARDNCRRRRESEYVCFTGNHFVAGTVSAELFHAGHHLDEPAYTLGTGDAVPYSVVGK